MIKIQHIKELKCFGCGHEFWWIQLFIWIFSLCLTSPIHLNLAGRGKTPTLFNVPAAERGDPSDRDQKPRENCVLFVFDFPKLSSVPMHTACFKHPSERLLVLRVNTCTRTVRLLLEFPACRRGGLRGHQLSCSSDSKYTIGSRAEFSRRWGSHRKVFHAFDSIKPISDSIIKKIKFMLHHGCHTLSI